MGLCQSEDKNYQESTPLIFIDCDPLIIFITFKKRPPDKTLNHSGAPLRNWLSLGYARDFRDVLNYLNNLFKQPIVVTKCNRFPSLHGIGDTGDGHIKLAGKIGQRNFQLPRRPVTKQSFGINSRFPAAFAHHFIRVNVIDRCHFCSYRI